MKPIEIACRHQNADLTNCGADAQQLCNPPELGGQQFHQERVLDAAGIGEPEVTLSEAHIQNAIDGLWGKGII